MSEVPDHAAVAALVRSQIDAAIPLHHELALALADNALFIAQGLVRKVPGFDRQKFLEDSGVLLLIPDASEL